LSLSIITRHTISKRDWSPVVCSSYLLLLAGLPGDTEVTLADGAAADSREPLEVPDDGGRVEVEEASAGFVEGLDVRGGARPQVPEEVQGDVEQQVEDEGDDEQHERCRQQTSEDESDHDVVSVSIFREHRCGDHTVIPTAAGVERNRSRRARISSSPTPSSSRTSSVTPRSTSRSAPSHGRSSVRGTGRSAHRRRLR